MEAGYSDAQVRSDWHLRDEPAQGGGAHPDHAQRVPHRLRLSSATFASSYAQTLPARSSGARRRCRGALTAEDIDKTDIKTFGSPDKVVYFKGAAVGNAAISTTLDMVIYDGVLVHGSGRWRATITAACCTAATSGRTSCRRRRSRATD